jgi:ubiquinone biosynthesis protein Coq4
VKHVLTDYKSEGLDEIRLQVFMLGNGNYSLTCLLLCSMALIFPEHYATFKTDFAKGSLCKPLKSIDLKEHKMTQLDDLKKELKIDVVYELMPLTDLAIA